ncbi:MAG: hypothetical protein MJ185_02625 [Treponema sp.]|nr:hypothetical protein [Treponema sp.]
MNNNTVYTNKKNLFSHYSIAKEYYFEKKDFIAAYYYLEQISKNTNISKFPKIKNNIENLKTTASKKILRFIDNENYWIYYDEELLIIYGKPWNINLQIKVLNHYLEAKNYMNALYWIVNIRENKSFSIKDEICKKVWSLYKEIYNMLLDNAINNNDYKTQFEIAKFQYKYVSRKECEKWLKNLLRNDSVDYKLKAEIKSFIRSNLINFIHDIYTSTIPSYSLVRRTRGGNRHSGYNKIC